MILTDDNFATIVTAVEGGRGLYDNLMKYIRVQMIMLFGFILTFVGAGIFAIANGTPLLPLQILWINFAIDVAARLRARLRRAHARADEAAAPAAGGAGDPRGARGPARRSSACSSPSARSSRSPGPRTATASPSRRRWASSRRRCCTSRPPSSGATPSRSVFNRSTIANGRFNLLILAGARPHPARDHARRSCSGSSTPPTSTATSGGCA